MRDQRVAGIRQRHVAAGDGRGARAAVRLQHIAVERDGALAQRGEIGDRAQRAADQPLDFLRAAALLALGRLARRARMRGARQHAVFGGDPALVLAAQEAGHAFFDAGGAQHPRVAELDQHRAFGVLRESTGETYGAQLIRRATAGTSGHQALPIQRTTAAEVLSLPAPTTLTERSARRSSSSRSGARAGGKCGADLVVIEPAPQAVGAD